VKEAVCGLKKAVMQPLSYPAGISCNSQDAKMQTDEHDLCIDLQSAMNGRRKK